MNNLLSIVESSTSIIAIGGVFILWILSKNFVSKEELRKEVTRIENNIKEETTQIYGKINNQALNIKELDTKMDILITSVNKLGEELTSIKDYLIKSKKK